MSPHHKYLLHTPVPLDQKQGEARGLLKSPEAWRELVFFFSLYFNKNVSWLYFVSLIYISPQNKNFDMPMPIRKGKKYTDITIIYLHI